MTTRPGQVSGGVDVLDRPRATAASRPATTADTIAAEIAATIDEKYPGAVVATITQTMEITGVRRTTINKWMGEGRLDVLKNGRRVTITIPSIKRVMAENIRRSAKPIFKRGN